MVVNRAHIPWAIFVAVLTAVFGVLFVANYHPGLLPWPRHLPAFFGPVPPLRRTYGGTPLGLAMGAFSLAIFLFASGLGIRKKRRLWPIGNVRGWLRAHIWLTILTIPLILLHCGFHFGGLMTSSLMILYTVVMVSGFYGLAMQHIVPKLMTRTLSQEAVYEQIPYVRKLLVDAADKLWEELSPKVARETVAAGHREAAGGSAVAVLTGDDEEMSRQTISRFLHDRCFPYLRASRGAAFQLSNQRLADETFRMLKLSVMPAWQERAELMERWCRDRRLLDLQERLHHWLHWWLLVHVPLSFALLVATFWHAYVTVIYL